MPLLRVLRTRVILGGMEGFSETNGINDPGSELAAWYWPFMTG
jgi:hypothetical protein